MTLDIAAWALERRGENLLWDGCVLSDLARSYGTPLFVFNKNRLEQSYREIFETFTSEGLAAKIFFSWKTNPVPGVLKPLIECGAGAEVVSEFEIWLAKKLCVAGRKVVVNGSLKSSNLLRQAVEVDAALINAETVAELRLLHQIAHELNKPVNVGLRINPSLKTGRFDFTTSTGSASSHIGFIPGSSEWKTALRILGEDSFLRLRGLHFHIGSGIRTANPYDEALNAALKVWRDLLEQGFGPSVLDIGGGFQIPTLKLLSALDAIRLFGWNRSPATQPQKKYPSQNLLREIARLCVGKLQEFSRRHGCPMPAVYIEPGRALVASSSLLLLTVGAVVEREKGPAFAVCDGGALSLSPLLLSEYHTILVSNKNANGLKKRYNIVGNLPTPLDIVSLGREMPRLSRGDAIAIMDVGAYFTSLGNNFAGPRPAIVMIENGSPVLIRRRETCDDLVSRDGLFK
jgi:diaminopimelate decarboxylase